MLERYRDLRQRLERKWEMKELPIEKEVGNELSLRYAIAVKIAEELEKRKIDLDDFAIILTPHPEYTRCYRTKKRGKYNYAKDLLEILVMNDEMRRRPSLYAEMI